MEMVILPCHMCFCALLTAIKFPNFNPVLSARATMFHFVGSKLLQEVENVFLLYYVLQPRKLMNKSYANLKVFFFLKSNRQWRLL